MSPIRGDSGLKCCASCHVLRDEGSFRLRNRGPAKGCYREAVCKRCEGRVRNAVKAADRRKAGVYTVETPEGAVYVGSSKNTQRRWRQHRVGSRTALAHLDSEPSQWTFVVLHPMPGATDDELLTAEAATIERLVADGRNVLNGKSLRAPLWCLHVPPLGAA